ncbi:MAG: hypothetical protein PHP59_10080, partial [Methanofollis sp.]|uniref:hypothetical protein n=1 Tax=Methanofollis sp. TaxID=2052835 RepID=UPI00260B733A
MSTVRSAVRMTVAIDRAPSDSAPRIAICTAPLLSAGEKIPLSWGVWEVLRVEKKCFCNTPV